MTSARLTYDGGCFPQVLYLEDELVSGVDETISGRLRMGANPENHRDMDIALSYEFRGEHSDVVAEHQYQLR